MPRNRLLASERLDLQTALGFLPDKEAFIQRLLARFRPFTVIEPGARVLDVGAAQGVTTAAFARAGFDAWGVEPWLPAIAVSRELGGQLGLKLNIREGVAERLPFDDASFDLVVAYSVMEHVDDPLQVFREVYRVLRPDGGFFFATSGVLKPTQHEIAGFSLFPWYPPRVQKAIMRWAAENRPALVGNTTRPAMHWFRVRSTRLCLSAIGFRRLVDQWELRAASGELSGARKYAVRAAATNRVVRFVGNVVVGSVEFFAVK